MSSTARSDLFGESHGISYCTADVCLLKKKVFSSWDRFQIPYPGGKGLYVWGQPLWVTPDRSPKQISEEGMELERILNDLTARAELAIHSDDPVQQFLHNMKNGREA